MRKLTQIFWAVSIAVAVCISCAKVPVETVPEIYWPLPPEKPRIKFVDIIMGSIDVTGTRSEKFKQLLFGEEIEVGFSKPYFVTARNNVVYVSDIWVVHVFDFNRKSYKVMGSGLLKHAAGIGVAHDGRLYMADSAAARIYVLNASGKHIQTIGVAMGIASLGGLTIDDVNGRVLACDTKGHKVFVFSLEGELLFPIGKRGNAPGDFNFPYAVRTDMEGRIYVVDSGNFRVQIFDRDGRFLSTFGSVGAVPGTFSRPRGIALDSEGHIYIVDSGFGNFQILDYSGQPLLAVGSYGGAPGQFSLPFDIFIDENDKIYVVDQINRRIQVFQYLKDR